MKSFFRDWVYENGSYKLVALFITLILWVSVLGRKETTVSKEVGLVYQTAQEKIVSTVSAKTVRFELAGSRRAMKKFIAEKTDPILVDLSSRASGRIVVGIPEDSLRLPFGVKVLGVNPPTVVVDIEDIEKKKIPVVVTWKNHESNHVILTAKIEQSEIVIEGAKTSLSRIREVVTSEVSSSEAVEINGRKVIKTHIHLPEIDGIKPIENQEITITF